MAYLDELRKKLGIIQDNFIDQSDSILVALKKMDKEDVKLLLVFDQNKFKSVLSIGDIQRSIIKNIPLEKKISEILRKKITVCYSDESFDEVKAKMLALRTECMPVLSRASSELASVYFWSDLFDDKSRLEGTLDLPLVVMAGGQGTRLKPITHIIPKPLVPINEKPIVELIIDSFNQLGCNKVYMTVNYKKEMIKFYFDQIEDKKYDLSFLNEDKPLGTAGSLSFLKDKIDTSFFVSNCDILVRQDYREVLAYHKHNKNDLTILSALSHYQIPYGTLVTGDKGELIDIEEKPEKTFMINTGVYLLEPELLKMVPENTFFHMTDLIEEIRKSGGKVGVYPVSGGSWVDIGQWKDYQKHIKVSL